MTDQANEAIDPMDTAAALIANSLDESDPPEEDEEQPEATEETGEESEDAQPEEEGATEAPKEVVFAGQKFDLPANTPPEVVEKVAEIGKQLQGDYTRKTQELASREKQAAEIVQNELKQGQQHINQALQQARAVIQAVVGFMDPAQLAQLAETDPAAWVQANARQQQLGAYMAHLQQQAQELDQQVKQADAQRMEAAKQEAWQRLNAEGIDRKGLEKLWMDAKQTFNLTDERLSQVLDADSWLVLRDAIAYRQLKAQTPAVTKKVAEAPQLPKAKQPMPQEVRQRLDARKAVTRKGGASMRDLAAFIATNQR